MSANTERAEQEVPEETIWVARRPEIGDRVGLWERHPAHPGGVVMIDDDDPHEVAQTPEVMSRLAPRLADGGQLVRLEGRALSMAQDRAATRREQAEQARIAAAGFTPLPAVLEQQTVSRDEVEAANRRGDELQARLDEQSAKLDALIAQLTARAAAEHAAQPAASEASAAEARANAADAGTPSTEAAAADTGAEGETARARAPKTTR